MSDSDAGQQYVPLNKLKVYRSNGLVNNLLRKLNFSSKFSLQENAATDSVDIDILSGIFGLDDLDDVLIQTPTEKQVIRRNATGWTNSLLSLDDLSDVVITGTPVTGHILQHDGVNFKNVALVQNLDALSDVIITSPATGHILQHNGTNFVNAAPSAVSLSLDNLTDVVITTPASGHQIVHNGTNWVNQAPAAVATRESLEATMAYAGDDDIGTAYQDMLWIHTTVNGSSVSGTKAIAPIDFTNKTQYKVSIGVVAQGNDFDIRLVDDATPTNILHEFLDVSDSTPTSVLATLPVWATGVKTLRLQAKGNASGQDLGIPSLSVYLK